MEAAGVATAAHSHGVEWFAVHGVGDVAGIQEVDENSIPYARPVAARFVCGALEFCRPFAE
uniref:hypothetical protein n=1 Tax=Paractinoplanes polyasparticus TaxID=2856853 RepID=UPI0034DB0C49